MRSHPNNEKSPLQLAGKVAIVLGAVARDNMGQAIAPEFAAAGASVVVAGRHEAPLRQLAEEISGAWALCDINSKAQSAKSEHGRNRPRDTGCRHFTQSGFQTA